MTRPLLLALCLAACARAPGALDHGRRDAPKVALTFDACPSRGGRSGCDDALADELVRARVPATLFLGGKWIEDRPERARALARVPWLEIGTHGWGHRRLARLPDAEIRADLARALATHARVLGRRPALFRPPYAAYDARVVRLARESGLTVVGADVPSGDPDPRFTSPVLVRWVTESARAGSIVVLHLNGRGLHTREALPGILAGLRGAGLSPVTVGELLLDLQPSLFRPSRAATL